MSQASLSLNVQDMASLEEGNPWRQTSTHKVAELLDQVAGRFVHYGDALAFETAERVGVSPAEVWLETIFPCVWGLLSLRHTLLARAQSCPTVGELTEAVPDEQFEPFAGKRALRMLPGNWLESLLLPGFSGYVLISEEEADLPETQFKEGLALCLMPFNLTSIGALDIVHLLCNRAKRVVAKVSERAEFTAPHLERIFEPFLKVQALSFAFGGPEVGAWLAAKPEFSEIHLTGGKATAASVAKVGGGKALTFELGGITPAIVFPDAATEPFASLVARQIAFGALANNGQHCVSFQIVVVPQSRQAELSEKIWAELNVAGTREPRHDGKRMLVDPAAARRLEDLVQASRREGARTRPELTAAEDRLFPICLIAGLVPEMRLFREEAFGPVLGVMALPDEVFFPKALNLANSTLLGGDLGISIFTSQPNSAAIQEFAVQLRHGMVAINTYPGVSFATSLPWGPGASGLSGYGWVHNYEFLPGKRIEKVVLSAPLGKKGFGIFRWEDPWLLNVCGEHSLKLAQSLTFAAVAYFRKKRWKLAKALATLSLNIVRRELSARVADRK